MNNEWTRAERLAMYSLVIAIIGILVALFIPELRRTLSLNAERDLVSPNNSQTDASSGNSPANSFSTPVAFNNGSFQVSASSLQGTLFSNPVNRAVSIEFTASGQWAFWPEQGFHSATGNPNYPVASQSGSDYKLPEASIGSLVIHRGDGRYELIGNGRTIELLPNERAFFSMNDGKTYSSSYNDNQGTITVRWVCLDCKE